MPTWLIQCPSCRCWYVVDTDSSPACPAAEPSVPGTPDGATPSAAMALWVPVLASVVSVAGALAVLVWHRGDPGAVVASVSFTGMAAVAWWRWMIDSQQAGS